MLTSDAVKSATKTVPGFASSVVALAEKAIDKKTFPIRRAVTEEE